MADDVVQTLGASICMSVRTFRKDGSAVATPMWCTPIDGKLFNYTDDRTHKIKRMRRDPRVELAACDVWGKTSTPFYAGSVRIVEDPVRRAQVFEALRKKYHIHWYLSLWGSLLTNKVKHRLVLEYTLSPP